VRGGQREVILGTKARVLLAREEKDDIQQRSGHLLLLLQQKFPCGEKSSCKNLQTTQFVKSGRDDQAVRCVDIVEEYELEKLSGLELAKIQAVVEDRKIQLGVVSD